MGSIMVFSEREDLAFELLGKGRELAAQMGLELTAAALGPSDPKEYQRRGAARVFHSNHDLLKNFDASVYAQALAQAARSADACILFIGSTRRGKEVAASLAQKMDAGCLTDVKSFTFNEGRLLAVRNSFGGATEATQVILTKVQIFSIMPRSFEPPPVGDAAGKIVGLTLDLSPSRVKMINRSEKESGAADVEGADVLVCVGKGLGGPEDLKGVEELAAVLGGVVACSKPVATDLKWLPESRIIGLSGRKAKPLLALCLGVSGQVQFTVGIREAKTIVAVNTDPNAYIFQITDYGLIADLHEAVPLLISALKS